MTFVPGARRILLLAAALCAAPWSGDTLPAADDARTVSLVVDDGKGKPKRFEAIPWSKGMTVLEAMQAARSVPPKLTFEHSGRGKFAFLKSIDGVENEGGGRKARNWQFRVNGEYAKRGFGVYELEPDDRVTWKFETFERKRK